MMMFSAGASAASGNKPGKTDTAINISGHYSLSLKNIMKWKKWGLSPECIFPGQNIFIPDQESNCPEQDTTVPDDEIIIPDYDGTNPDDEITVPDENLPLPDDDTIPEQDTGIHRFESEVVRLVNEIRAQNGLASLTHDSELSKVARIKSQDMKDKNYFSHESPTYGSPFDMMKTFGISYRSAAENIAKGQTSAEAVVNAWMNSAGHRKNILGASYTHIGVGYVANGNYWTQMFVGR
ncbi:MAG: serine protease [Clostridia bacterium]|nr:serine protease [Clostridia bacterium]